MSAPQRAFRGLLADFDHTPHGVVFAVLVDLAQCGALMVAIGAPPGLGRCTWCYDLCPSVALFPCSTPQHPVQDGEILAEAAIDGLLGMLEGGLPLTPRLALRFDALRARLDGTPIHLMPDDDGPAGEEMP